MFHFSHSRFVLKCFSSVSSCARLNCQLAWQFFSAIYVLSHIVLYHCLVLWRVLYFLLTVPGAVVVFVQSAKKKKKKQWWSRNICIISTWSCGDGAYERDISLRDVEVGAKA